jgi:hypothetical protein
MDRHTADLGGWIVQRHPPELRKTRIGGVMVQKAGTPPPHARVRVREPPEYGIDPCLACSTQGLNGFHDHVPVVVTQLDGQCLQLTSRSMLKFIVAGLCILDQSR